MPRSVKSSSSASYSKLWKDLTEHAIFPTVHNKLYNSKNRKKQGGGTLNTLHGDCFTPICKLKKKKKKSFKQRGGFIRGGSRILPTSQKQCAPHSLRNNLHTAQNAKYTSGNNIVHKPHATAHTIKQPTHRLLHNASMKK